MLTVTRLVAHIANKTNVEPTFVVEREFGSKGDLFVEYIGDYSTRSRPSQVHGWPDAADDVVGRRRFQRVECEITRFGKIFVVVD